MTKQTKPGPTLAVAPETGEPAQAGKDAQGEVKPPPNPEVLEKPARRKFSAAYKLKILRLADACAPGQLGALRREGLYSSHLSKWRQQRDAAKGATRVSRA